MQLQKGAIPPLLIVALILAAVLGGIGGYKLGDGGLFSIGVGFGLVFVVLLFLAPHIDKFLDLLKRFRQR